MLAAQEALSPCHIYPEHDAGHVRRTLSAFWQVSPEHLIVSPGSTSLIYLISRTLLGPGTSAVASERSFLAYSSAVTLSGADMLLAPMKHDSIALDEVLKTLRPDTRVVFLANPNNPTGTAFGTAAWSAFLEAVPEHVLVVLDEAYAEYAQDIPSGIEEVRRGARVMILRSFSKAYGLAGLRIGYGIGPTSLVEILVRAAVPFAVSHPAQLAACHALTDTAFLERSIQCNQVGRQRLLEGLTALGLSPTPSQANFIYLELGRPAAPVAEALLKRGVRVRPLTVWGIPTALRITVGTPEAVEYVLKTLASLPKEMLLPLKNDQVQKHP